MCLKAASYFYNLLLSYLTFYSIPAHICISNNICKVLFSKNVFDLSSILLKRISIIWQADILLRFYLSRKARGKACDREHYRNEANTCLTGVS